jgi:hypothetical protein
MVSPELPPELPELAREYNKQGRKGADTFCDLLGVALKITKHSTLLMRESWVILLSALPWPLTKMIINPLIAQQLEWFL